MGLWIDPQARLEYVLERERELPEAEQTKWTLRPLTAREYATFKDRSSHVGEGGHLETDVFLFDVELLRLALCGCSGPGAPAFPDPVTPEAVEAFLDLVPADARDELSHVAYGMNRVGEESGKD